jgi:RNA polymerase sigma factor (sigma-70 family)
MEESLLINECLKGNPKAQRLLFDRFSKIMFTVCLRYSSDYEEAQDVLQDGFVKVFNKLENFNQKGSFEGWIRRIIVNTALDAIRKNKKFQYDVSMDLVDYQVSDNNEYIFESLVAEDLLKLINKMPDGYKVVFNLFAIEGFGHAEIAEMLGITESTSKSQYMRAKAYLKGKLELLGDGR